MFYSDIYPHTVEKITVNRNIKRDESIKDDNTEESVSKVNTGDGVDKFINRSEAYLQVGSHGRYS